MGLLADRWMKGRGRLCSEVLVRREFLTWFFVVDQRQLKRIENRSGGGGGGGGSATPVCRKTCSDISCWLQTPSRSERRVTALISRSQMKAKLITQSKQAGSVYIFWTPQVKLIQDTHAQSLWGNVTVIWLGRLKTHSVAGYGFMRRMAPSHTPHYLLPSLMATILQSWLLWCCSWPKTNHRDVRSISQVSTNHYRPKSPVHWINRCLSSDRRLVQFYFLWKAPSPNRGISSVCRLPPPRERLWKTGWQESTWNKFRHPLLRFSAAIRRGLLTEQDSSEMTCKDQCAKYPVANWGPPYPSAPVLFWSNPVVLVLCRVWHLNCRRAKCWTCSSMSQTNTK